MAAYTVDGFGNSGKESKAVKLKHGVDVAHSVEKSHDQAIKKPESKLCQD